MNSNRLGRSGLVVSDICLGTMTFGSQTDEEEAFAVMDKAVEAGIDFFDAAEMYPVPPDAKYIGATEQIIGRWMKARGIATTSSSRRRWRAPVTAVQPRRCAAARPRSTGTTSCRPSRAA